MCQVLVPNVQVVVHKIFTQQNSHNMDFSQVKLKKTQTVDKSGPHVHDVAKVKKEAIENHQNQVLALLSNWYKIIEPYTFKTVFIPIEKPIAQALMDAYKQFVKTGTFQFPQVLQPFADTLTAQIKESFPSGTCFMKTSQRSPKDVLSTSSKSLYDLFQQELAKLTPQEQMQNQWRIIAMTIAATSLLCVSNGNEAVELLIRSRRVFEDLHEHVAEYSDSSLMICLREWDLLIDIRFEFRAFVCKGQMNAMSQYNYIGYWPTLAKNKQLILSKIMTLFDIVSPLLAGIGVTDYVIDFALSEDLQHIVVIEV